MMLKLSFILNLIILICLFGTTNAEIKIKYKIYDDIITNIDIKNEGNYLLFIRPELKKLKEEELLLISENSLIREIIKKRELNKIYKNIGNIKFEEEIISRLIKFKNLDNSNELKKLLKDNNLEYYQSYVNNFRRVFMF